MCKLSIIVPVYNSEKHILRCLDSVKKQIFSDFEVIIVDDGSFDKSADKIRDYCLADNRFKYFYKTNGGASTARNYGLEKAVGEYIGFVDSDDWIDEDMYLDMFEVIQNHNVDIVLCDYNKIIGDKIVQKTHNLEEGLYVDYRLTNKFYDSVIMDMRIEFPITVTNCLMVIKRKIIFDNGIKYLNVRYCEDLLFGSECALESNSIYYMKHKYFYNYFDNEDSVTNQYHSDKFEVFQDIYNAAIDKFQAINDERIQNQLKCIMVYFTLNWMGELKSSNLSFVEMIEKSRMILNNGNVKHAFRDISIYDIGWKQKIICSIIKWRLTILLTIYNKL